jgi:hypothetical protein
MSQVTDKSPLLSLNNFFSYALAGRVKNCRPVSNVSIVTTMCEPVSWPHLLHAQHDVLAASLVEHNSKPGSFCGLNGNVQWATIVGAAHINAVSQFDSEKTAVTVRRSERLGILLDDVNHTTWAHQKVMQDIRMLSIGSIREDESSDRNVHPRMNSHPPLANQFDQVVDPAMRSGSGVRNAGNSQLEEKIVYAAGNTHSTVFALGVGSQSESVAPWKDMSVTIDESCREITTLPVNDIICCDTLVEILRCFTSGPTAGDPFAVDCNSTIGGTVPATSRTNTRYILNDTREFMRIH